MDPFVSTVIKQALVWGAAAGLAVGAIVFFITYSSKITALQHAMTLNMIPPQLS